MDLINFYETKGVKKFMKDVHNPNFKIHNIKVPFRMLIIGASGTGKTSTLLNLIKQMDNTFAKIHVILKSAQEPLYQYLHEATGGDKTKMVTLDEYDKKGLPPLDQFNSEDNNLIVLDDLITLSEKQQKPISEYFIRARKKNISVVYLSQSFYMIPRLIRQNVQYIILKQVASTRNLLLIMKECSLGASKEEMIEMYKDATKEFTSFLLLDLDNPKRSFRKNFDSYYELEESG